MRILNLGPVLGDRTVHSGLTGLQHGPQRENPNNVVIRNTIGVYLLGSLYSFNVPAVFLGFPFWVPLGVIVNLWSMLSFNQICNHCCCMKFVEV